MPAGIGLTWRQLLAALKDLPKDAMETLLDQGVIVVGAQGGYDFVDNLVPLGRPIMTKAGPLFEKGRLVLRLQDANVC